MRLLAVLPFALVATAHAAEYKYLAPGDGARLRCDAPAGWQAPELDERSWLASDGGAQPIVDGACSTLRFRRRFDVGPEAAHLPALTLHVRYHDGFVAWLNGVEVARRRLSEGSALADEPHGPEAERFVIPLVPGMLRPAGNVLAVEVRPARANAAPSGEAWLDGADAVRIVRGPYLQRVLDGEAWVHLETDVPTEVAVRFSPVGATRAFEREAKSPALATRHAVRLVGLEPGVAYRYQVTASIAGFAAGVGPATVEARFHTPPTRLHPLRFVVFGDVRSGHDVHAEITRAVAAEDPDLVLLTGDLVDRGTDEGDWERYFDIAAPLLQQVAVYPAIGNHEYASKRRGLDNYRKYFPHDGPTWWSFDAAGVHFVCLDSQMMRDPEQRAWLERDLPAARARGVRAIFAWNHDGPWSSQLHGDNAVAVHDYAPLLERYGVAVIFSGHDHDYERGRVGEVNYVVSGGGGAELRTPKCGVPKRRSCGPRVKAFANEHHYIVVDVQQDRFRLCPKRADGTLLEACPVFPIRR